MRPLYRALSGEVLDAGNLAIPLDNAMYLLAKANEKYLAYLSTSEVEARLFYVRVIRELTAAIEAASQWRKCA